MHVRDGSIVVEVRRALELTLGLRIRQTAWPVHMCICMCVYVMYYSNPSLASVLFWVRGSVGTKADAYVFVSPPPLFCFGDGGKPFRPVDVFAYAVSKSAVA